tara:strand:- start:2337 stop:3962 length:1626 start_codon:yes stop_codon:yes gene_type:complete
MRKKYKYQLGGLMSFGDSTDRKVAREERRNRALHQNDLVGLADLQKMKRQSRRRTGAESGSAMSNMMSEKSMQDRADEVIRNRRQRMMASGGVVKLQEGGTPTRRSRGYKPRALPTGYGGPQGYQGYGMPGSFQQRQEFVAPELASQYADLTQGIMDAGTRTYDDIRYRGPRLAGFTPEEQAYKAAVTRIGTGEGPRATRQAEQTISEAATGIGSVATAAGAPSLLKGADLSPYESQYTQGVIDPQIRAIREAAKQQAAELGSSAAQAGAFGGYRHGLQESAIGQQEIQQIGDVTAQGAEDAFRSAQAAQQQDAAAEAAARDQQMAAFGRLGGMGSSQMQLGQQMGDAEMRRLQSMRDAGMDTRRLQQTGYDMQKAEFEKEMQHPERQLKFMSGMLQQLPYQNITQQAMYQPQAGPMTTMLDATGQDIENLANYQAQQQATIPGQLSALSSQMTGPAPGMTNPAANPVSNFNQNPSGTGINVGPINMPNVSAINPAGPTLPPGNYGGGIIGMRNNQIASRLGGGMIPMYYGGGMTPMHYGG